MTTGFGRTALEQPLSSHHTGLSAALTVTCSGRAVDGDAAHSGGRARWAPGHRRQGRPAERRALNRGPRLTMAARGEQLCLLPAESRSRARASLTCCRPRPRSVVVRSACAARRGRRARPEPGHRPAPVHHRHRADLRRARAAAGAGRRQGAPCSSQRRWRICLGDFRHQPTLAFPHPASATRSHPAACCRSSRSSTPTSRSGSCPPQ